MLFNIFFINLGHHIGERAHVIEREQNVNSGDQEERQDFINIEEDEADDFNREWETKTRRNIDVGRITGSSRVRQSPHRALPAITAGPQRYSQNQNKPVDILKARFKVKTFVFFPYILGYIAY